MFAIARKPVFLGDKIARLRKPFRAILARLLVNSESKRKNIYLINLLAQFEIFMSILTE